MDGEDSTKSVALQEVTEVMGQQSSPKMKPTR
jgi:hypothetical protein